MRRPSGRLLLPQSPSIQACPLPVITVENKQAPLSVHVREGRRTRAPTGTEAVSIPVEINRPARLLYDDDDCPLLRIIRHSERPTATRSDIDSFRLKLHIAAPLARQYRKPVRGQHTDVDNAIPVAVCRIAAFHAQGAFVCSIGDSHASRIVSTSALQF